MKSTIELISCDGCQMQVVKKLRELFGMDLTTATQYTRSVPCVIASDLESSEAEHINYALQSVGATTNIIYEEQENLVPSPVSSTTVVQSAGNSETFQDNDRQTVFRIWSEYSERDFVISNTNKQIQNKKSEVVALNTEIKKGNDEIANNKRIKSTNGECMRPKYRPAPLLDFPDFEVVKWIFIAMTIVTFIAMLVLVAVNPNLIENTALKMNVPAGLFVWLGAPVIGLAGTILFVIGFVGYFMSENHKYNKNQKSKIKYFNTAKEVQKANEFLSKLDKFEQEIEDKKLKVRELENQITETQNYISNLPPVDNTLPMPNELRNANGLALLLNYMDTGRAYTLKEAVNIYYQDLNNAQKMEELRKQTAYAQEQMMNSRIAAENSRKTLEATNRAADAAERAAEAASEAADYERRTYWENIYYRNSRN